MAYVCARFRIAYSRIVCSCHPLLYGIENRGDARCRGVGSSANLAVGDGIAHHLDNRRACAAWVEDGLIGEELDSGGLSYPTGDEYQEFNLKSGEPLSKTLPWNESWGGASKVIDLILVKNPGASETRNTGLDGRDQQQGGGAQVPREYMQFTATEAGTYGVVVKQVSGSRPSWTQLQARSNLPPHTALVIASRTQLKATTRVC